MFLNSRVASSARVAAAVVTADRDSKRGLGRVVVDAGPPREQEDLRACPPAEGGLRSAAYRIVILEDMRTSPTQLDFLIHEMGTSNIARLYLLFFNFKASGYSRWRSEISALSPNILLSDQLTFSKCMLNDAFRSENTEITLRVFTKSLIFATVLYCVFCCQTISDKIKSLLNRAFCGCD
jgi:hypothetical protein